MRVKLILLKRNRPVTYEIHRGEILQDKNIVFITQDKEFATDIVNSYNKELQFNALSPRDQKLTLIAEKINDKLGEVVNRTDVLIKNLEKTYKKKKK